MTTETLGPTLAASIVGTTAGPLTQRIDRRWLMAYNAALSDAPPRPVAHPLFAVCYEWPVAVTLRERAVGRAIAPLSVHASHDLVIHRPARADDELTTTAVITDVVPRPSGALVLMRFDTVDGDHRPVTTTTYGSLYRGVRVIGDSRSAGAPVSTSARAASTRGDDSSVPHEWSETVQVAAHAAHVYTECARIWNPIHTDPAVARAAGLPGTILHGTATLALCVSQILERELDSDPTRVRGVRARFTGMVPLPSTFVVRCGARREHDITFDAVGPDGAIILREGAVSI